MTARASLGLLVLLAGCSDSLAPAAQVLGTWNVAAVSGPLFYGTGEASFRPDGTFLISGQWILQNGGDPVRYDVSGRYAVDSTQLVWSSRGTRVVWSLAFSDNGNLTLTGQPKGSLGLTSVDVTLTLTPHP